MRRAAVTLAGVMMALAMVGIEGASAQEPGRITGMVTSARSMNPLSEVQVFVSETSQGALSGQNGRYLILNVAPGTYTVTAQRIGYATQTQEVTVGAGEDVVLNFAMSEEALGLDEIVVTGTAGAARRREVGNVINQIDLTDAPSTQPNVDQILASQAPGLQMNVGSGAAGSGAQIRLRGAVSVNQSNQPLIFIDGVRVKSDAYAKNVPPTGYSGRSGNTAASPLNDINPNDIERIEIIKGAAASTLYGTEAAAGVIQIFTKRGSSGAPRWTAQIDQGFNNLAAFQPDVDVRPPGDPTFAETPEGEYSYQFLNMDPFLRTGYRNRYALSVAGGGQALQYFISAQTESNEGVLPNDDEDKINLRGNFTFTPLSNLSVQVNSSYTRTDVSNTATGNNAHGLTLNAFRRERNYFSSGDTELLRTLLNQDITTRIDRFILGTTLNWQPTSAFTNKLVVGYDQAAQDNRNLRPFGFVRAPLGILSALNADFTTLWVDYVGSYELDLSDDISTTLSFGGQSTTDETRTVNAEGRDFPGPGEPDIDAGGVTLAFENRLRVVNAGVFAQALFGFSDKYFITAGFRLDGNSAFGEDLNLQFLPRLSASYIMSDEDFWSDSWGSLKLRAAYGEAGRAPGAFDAVRTWSPVGYGGSPAFWPNNLGNPNLGPEITTEIEAGFDWAFLDNRVSTEFTYYRQETTGGLFDVRFPPSQGFALSQAENVGEMVNQGIELAIFTSIIDGQNWGFDFATNVYTNESEVLSLGGAVPFTAGGGWVFEGQPIMSRRGIKFRNGDQLADPRPCTESDGPDAVCFERDQFFGPAQPELILNFTPTIRGPYGVTLSARTEYQGGAYIQDGAARAGISRNVRWPTCSAYYELADAGQRAQTTMQQRKECEAGNAEGGLMIFSADHFRLRDVTLQVPLGGLVPGASNSTLTFTAQNAWLHNFDLPGFDPNQLGNTGFDSQNPAITEHVPAPRTFLMSLRMVF
jgi:TonB-dependent SusC/RagA subfamily outer membrane receptor